MRLVVPVWCVVCVFAFGAAPPRQPVVDTPPARQPAADTQPAREPAADTPAEPKRETPPPRIVIIEGQVTDAVGAGHTGVTVTVRRKGTDGHDGELIATTTTGEYGDFAVTADRPVSGDVVVTFTAEAYAPLVHELSLTPGADVPFLGEELEGNVVVIGRVIDGRTKDPVAGVAVTLDAAERDWDATTDAKGRFTIKGAFPGRGLLIAEADGYGREREPVERLEDFGEIILTIKPERIVHVRVVDDAGRAIRGVTVECYDRPRDDFRTYVSDDQGVVTMRRVHFDAASLLLRLTHPQHVSSVGFDKTLRLPAGEIESSHTITLPRAGRITGTVVDARSGETLYGARLVTGDAYADDTPRDWSDFEGHFAIEGVAPGQVTVTVHLAGYAPELMTVDVAVGADATLEVKLRPGAVLRGIVRHENGDPAVGAHVAATTWRGRSTLGLQALTDREGRFVLADAPRDAFDVVVTADGAPRGTTHTVTAGGETPVTITIPTAVPGGRPGGAAAVGAGAPAPPLHVTTLEGKSIKLADLKGKTVLLDFWATWCGPCVAEVPTLVALRAAYAHRADFVMISVSLDADKKTLTDFIAKKHMNWHHVFGDANGANRAADAYGVAFIPSVFIIGPNGKVVAAQLSGDALKRAVESILRETDPT